MSFGEPTGQEWVQIGELAVAFVLSFAIGVEREVMQTSAGMRTYSLVGVGSAVFVLVSKNGFSDTSHGFAAAELTTMSVDALHIDAHHDDAAQLPTVGVALALNGRDDLAEPTSILSEIDGVVGVRTGSADVDE